MQKGTLALRCVLPGVAAVWSWNDRSRSWRKCEAGKQKRDEKWWSCFELNQWIHGSSFLFVFPATWISVAGPEGDEERSGEKSSA
jgi:hypothetical protein